ncbi:MAG: thioredoxin-dependent thiol peroxidase [Rickettsiales bacterium]|jgi:peroxiredoxin Q/BCP|nr:thioredoxin-dependent thiol peroxidase [Rickettsiales bacterium]
MSSAQTVTSPALQEGNPAPDFTLPTDGNGSLTLSSLKGKNVVLYFYPKDDTPGCTQESKDFRDAIADFTKEDTVILGISKDDVKSHDKFKTKYELPFTLLSDTEGKVCEAYDVWKEKSMYGKKYMGIERTTILIDKEGVIRNIWRKVSVTCHVEEVLKSAKGL